MKWSVDELMKSPSGRKRLAMEQEKHKLDILQPGDPMFEKVWGEKRRKMAEEERKKVDKSMEYKEDYEKRKRFNQR